MIKNLLFLDDYRHPIDCAEYMHRRGVDVRIYHEKWFIVRSYSEFVKWITEHDMPDVISFDHDLCDTHYGMPELILLSSDDEKTGYDCAIWLVQYCIDNDKPLPLYIVHSMNPSGSLRIKQALEDFNKQR